MKKAQYLTYLFLRTMFLFTDMTFSKIMMMPCLKELQSYFLSEYFKEKTKKQQWDYNKKKTNKTQNEKHFT